MVEFRKGIACFPCVEVGVLHHRCRSVKSEKFIQGYCCIAESNLCTFVCEIPTAEQSFEASGERDRFAFWQLH
jgi:hypothetical protein